MTESTRDVRLREIRQRERDATIGPWHQGPHYKADVDSRVGVIRSNCWMAPQAIQDAAFIAHARQDIPFLLDELAAAEARLAQLEKGRTAVHYLIQRRGIAVLKHIRTQNSELGYQVGMLLGDIAQLLDVNDPSWSSGSDPYARRQE